ncbi:MAG TPA: SRPBCC domain-containing protein [Opitutaceae bacterium]|nr:SRPBCC domain-containing protein [Opitutaceae bacterium]
MPPKNSPAGTPDRRRIVVRRTFSAPAETVFDAWLDPAGVGRWLFATPTGKMARVEIDARVGGRFVLAEQRPDGLLEHVGVYREIVRPRRLAFDFTVPKFSSEATRVTIDFAPRGQGCEITLTHEGVLPEYASATTAGWTGILEHLAKLVPSAH